ncbi:helix-turn-helix transcriptional regulator [Accumulibacter sp.]|uniref:helix-turn-helix domain-containing protein n=1 Tax=Accumulibacter sp. TaxID=2053492 RepID=UPI0025D397FB|nr:helix-turn-helix transcriptional regulator [Accumulibacter sp.]MCP5228294.1 helix-turn-helix transcriptional regulator [Accumulibacter sp.]
MKILETSGNQAVIHELGQRLAAARLARNLTQATLAEEAGVAKRTLERLESGESATQLSGFIRVCRALGLLERLDALLPESAASPIAQLQLHGRKRQRASGRRPVAAKAQPWTWGEQP